jgi:hypothetical protein
LQPSGFPKCIHNIHNASDVFFFGVAEDDCIISIHRNAEPRLPAFELREEALLSCSVKYTVEDVDCKDEQIR